MADAQPIPVNRKRILICDDDLDILEVTSIVLVSAGYDVKTLAASDRFFECLSSFVPDLVLLDIWMPEVSGDVIAKLMKADKKLSHIPVLLFSANTNIEETARATGADGFVKKPFSLDGLKAVIEEHLKVNAGSRSTLPG